MTIEKTTMALGSRIYGLGVMAVGLASLVLGEFDPGQPVPEHFPARLALTYAAGAIMVIAAAAVEWQLAIAAAGLIIYASTTRVDAVSATRLTRLGQLVFGVCALVFGGAHFVYMSNTASLIPKWLPPTQEFWGYATGVAFVAAGVAILTGVQARLAAILLTAMLASFGVLVNGRILLTDLSSHWNWTESAVNLAVTGAAWVLADSLPPRER